MLRLALVLGARSAGCDISQLWIVFTPLVGPYSIGVLLLSYYQTISKKEVFLALIWLMLHSLLN